MASDTELHHEKLLVYGVALELVFVALPLADSFPRGYAYLADQLRRAVSSIPLNIAEACSRRSPSGQAQFYCIARGSAHESGAILDIARRLEGVDNEECLAAKRLVVRIVKMLVGLEQAARRR